MSKQLHEQVNDFKMIPFIWAVLKQVIKLGLVTLGFLAISAVGIFLFQLALTALVASNKGMFFPN